MVPSSCLFDKRTNGAAPAFHSLKTTMERSTWLVPGTTSRSPCSEPSLAERIGGLLRVQRTRWMVGPNSPALARAKPPSASDRPCVAVSSMKVVGRSTRLILSIRNGPSCDLPSFPPIGRSCLLLRQLTFTFNGFEGPLRVGVPLSPAVQELVAPQRRFP
jgi:hypothetical protein